MFIDICNTLFLYGVLSTWCGPVNPVDPVVHPDQGTVLNSSCAVEAQDGEDVGNSRCGILEKNEHKNLHVHGLLFFFSSWRVYNSLISILAQICFSFYC